MSSEPFQGWQQKSERPSKLSKSTALRKGSSSGIWGAVENLWNQKFASVGVWVNDGVCGLLGVCTLWPETESGTGSTIKISKVVVFRQRYLVWPRCESVNQETPQGPMCLALLWLCWGVGSWLTGDNVFRSSHVAPVSSHKSRSWLKNIISTPTLWTPVSLHGSAFCAGLFYDVICWITL